MAVVLLLVIVFSSFILSVLPGLKAKELVDSGQDPPSTMFEDLLEELNGAHLRIAATHLPPTMIIEKNSDGTFRYSGFSADACHYLSQLFKFTYSFVNTVEEEVKKSGTIGAEGNLLMRNEADIANNQISASNQSIPVTRIQKRAALFLKYFKENPDRTFTTPQQRFDMLYAGDAAYAYNEILSLPLLDALNKKAGYCKITIASKLRELTQFHRVFLFKKNWRYTDAMRNRMQWWSDTGLAMHWIKSYLPSSKRCLFEDYKKNSPAIRVFSLEDLSGAFVVLLMGCALSLLAFLVEKIHYYRTMRLSS